MKGIEPEILRGMIVDVLDQYAEFFPKTHHPVELLMLTAAQETHLGALGRRQMGGGPALGIFQMEPATYWDCWERFVKGRQKLQKMIAYDWNVDPWPTKMAESDDFAILMARVKYRLVPMALPREDDLYQLAAYYKRWWNTPLGAATVEVAQQNYQKYC